MTVAEAAERLAGRVRGALIAAPATPRYADGRVALGDLGRYAGAIAGAADGVCVWAHTARGLAMTDAERDAVLTAFRAVTDGPVIAAVGPSHDGATHRQPGSAGGGNGAGEAGHPAGGGAAGRGDAGSFEAELAATVRMAERAAAGGADGLMVYPVAGLREPATRVERTVRLHREVAARAGLPVAAFLLYPEAGGVPYGPALLGELAGCPEVFAVKVATLYDAVACQEAIAAVRGAGAVALTGEDRMFGPSLMWGADGALVGVAAAAVEVSRRLVRGWFGGDAAAFLDASRRLDALAAATFTSPVDGYVQRMLWIAEREGIVPAGSAHDPDSGPLPDGERDRVLAAYDALA